ncbi:hypothetical protein H6G89_22925 [Oscillatoria sp. FACHB-1407]|uniref:hypothetical protein n=1 Tax=Oscillatoria sp. FACHB-1407 TaxID=2692847 RepID=UPI00168272BC|nr:hypothetical protein [Oscillatoria sp. FACHB-1407]MBD2463859.1 hypothetical protein [Oscillatoria sp. FACHB-1407]
MLVLAYSSITTLFTNAVAATERPTIILPINNLSLASTAPGIEGIRVSAEVH